MPKENAFWTHFAAVKRYASHCSIDVLFHAGTLWITRAVGVSREKRHG